VNDVARVRALLSVATKVGKLADLIDMGAEGIDQLMPVPFGMAGAGDGGNRKRQIQIAVTRLAWHSALLRLMRANQRLDAAINGFADSPHPGDLPPDERHIAGLVAAAHADALAEYWAASGEVSAAQRAELQTHTAFEDALGANTELEDYPDWYDP